MKDHLKNVCMSYCEHFILSFGFSCRLFIGSIQAFIHALFPNIYIDSTTKLTKYLQKTMQNVGCHGS